MRPARSKIACSSSSDRAAHFILNNKGGYTNDLSYFYERRERYQASK